MKKYKKLFEAKSISAGTLITDGTRLLVGHVPLSSRWDIPKGQQDEGESILDTARREMWEEFRLKFPIGEYQKIGLFKYSSSKDLFLYKIETDLNNINLGSLKCNSYFQRYGKTFPEIDDYKIISIEEIPKFCAKVMVKVLRQVFII